LLGEATFQPTNPSHAIDDLHPMTSTLRPQPRNRFLATALALTIAPLCAQAPQRQISTLPATSPTALPAANTLQAPIAATPDTTHPSREPKRAEVTYAAGLINVRADNSSLNQILHAISRLTDMTITGGVADERVFGNYGPAEPSTILATLLDGTGSNMLLRISTTDAPSELVLTPRNGGPTPPNPNAGRFDDEDANQPRQLRLSDRMRRQAQPLQPQVIPQQAQAPAQQQHSGPPSIPQPANNVNGSPDNTSPTAASFPTTNSVPLDSVPTPSTTPSTSGIVDSPHPPPPRSTTRTRPNGVATPDQIYQQLLQMQKQKAAASSSTTTTTPQ
jgi:hypothetical protein